MPATTDLPTQLKFTLGGYLAECHEAEWQRGKLWYRRAAGAYLWQPAVELTPTPEAWTRFWRTMETVGVWQWQKDYQDNSICDGTQWSLKLHHRERKVRCEGSNAYPGSTGPDYSPTGDFAHFLQALRLLTGQAAI
ncbi:MAG: hypothetical protein WCS42_22535 [Verrucomicrobiota bacterium]